VSSTNTFAQTTNATLGGTVSDASGALIPGVTITAMNTQTGIVTTVLTNEAGAYQFASLQTGTYKVSAELPGFQTQNRSEVALGVSQQVRLNFTLQVGAQTQTVEVNVAADTLIATTSSSVGAVLPEYKVRDLPLATRNVLDLVGTTAGTGGGTNFAGGRLGQVNTTRDGVPVDDGRYPVGVSASTYVSPDLVDEVRVIVAPADAEMGRGSGQVQMSTRSGTNQLRGSLFWTNRNSALDANSWTNNFNGVQKDYRNGNQFGVRLGGPIIKNKTFFFFLYEGQRYVRKEQFIGPVLTGPARQGIFRFFPGVQNGNLLSNNPTVDVSGNPVRPQGATGDLQSFSVFGRDSLRPGFDTSGWEQRLIARMPPANNFTTCGLTGTAAAFCDGLNVAGHRWLRRIQGEDTTNGDGNNTNRNQYNLRLDHNFNAQHKVSFSGTRERDTAMSTQAGISNWPGGYDGRILREPYVYSASWVSTLSPTILNEFRFGTRRNKNYSWGSALRPDQVGDETRKQGLSQNGQIFFPSSTLFPEHFIANLAGNGSRGQTSPLYTYNDALSWTQGKHAFKTGAEVRFTSSRGFNGSENPAWVFPTVSIGAGSTPVTGINTIPGLTGANVTLAQNMLLELSGSVGNVSQTYNIQSPSDKVFTLPVRVKDYHQNEWGAFFKDDWKIRPNLTLNLGVRYDYYGVPWEKKGAQVLPVGGGAGLFGISGTSFADMWRPGSAKGSVTTVQFVGKNSPNPDTQWYKDDWNNFAPAVGFSWSLPWFGKDKTVLRAGYGISYQGSASFNSGINLATGSNPGLSYSQSFTTLGLAANYYNLSTVNVRLPDPPATVKPLDLIVAGDTFPRTRTMFGFDDKRVNPYIQNWNLEIQRELASNLTLEARYIGSKGTKLLNGLSLNDVNIFENGILEAFNVTRAGSDAPLFDRMLRGLNLGSGVINGTTVTGSASLRANSLSRGFLADGNVGQFANFLNTSTTVTGVGGGLLRNSGLFPENFITVNPQFAAVLMQTNPSGSTYHSANLQLTKRLSHGFTNQFAYTWSRTLGQANGGAQGPDGNVAYINPRDRSRDKGLVGFHRTHDIRSNGTFELPFGPNRRFLSSGSGFLTRLVERWQLGGIFSWTSGAPLTITASGSTFTFASATILSQAQTTPVILGDFPKSSGKVTPVANGATYFAGLKQITDPSKATVTTAQGLQSQFSKFSIAGAQGNPILVNPAPGQLGTLGLRWIEGPPHVGLDVNLVKRVSISERKEFEIRVDAVNVLNTPYWTDPVTDINSPNFGNVTGAGITGSNQRDNVTGARTFTINARLNF
jgi:hypothetical protein